MIEGKFFSFPLLALQGGTCAWKLSQIMEAVWRLPIVV